MKIQREREGRSLHRLSTELYSKDTHFVLELVQNADDNTYPLTGEDQDQIPRPSSLLSPNDKVPKSFEDLKEKCSCRYI